jgi:hypothetical protein
VEATNALITSYPQTRIQETPADSFTAESWSNVLVDDVALAELWVFRLRRHIVHDYGSETDLTPTVLVQPGAHAPIRQHPLEGLPGVVQQSIREVIRTDASALGQELGP